MRIRKLNRLKGYDYSLPGAYFITICVNHMRRVFGEIRNGEMILNQWKLIAHRQWEWLFLHYPYLEIDQYIIMPDHMHGIIHIRNGARHHDKIKPIPELIGAFKTTSSKAIHLCGNPDFKWKKSYHDRIIRNTSDLYRIRLYIKNNSIVAQEMLSAGYMRKGSIRRECMRL